MGPLLIIVAINAKWKWLKYLCFLIAIIGSVAGIISAGEMVSIALMYQVIGWIVCIIIGYAIRWCIKKIEMKTNISALFSIFSSLLTLISLIPRALWRFTLNRVQELGKAFRGEN